MELHGKSKKMNEWRVGTVSAMRESDAQKKVKAAELVVKMMEAEEQGYVTIDLSVPVAGDRLMQELEDGFLSTNQTEEAVAWNEQRRQVLSRCLRELMYPLLSRETLEMARREANDLIVTECATRLRQIAMAAPMRPNTVRGPGMAR